MSFSVSWALAKPVNTDQDTYSVPSATHRGPSSSFLPCSSLDARSVVLNPVPPTLKKFSIADIERKLFCGIKNVVVNKKVTVMCVHNVFVPQQLTGKHKCLDSSPVQPSCLLIVTRT